MQRFRGFALVLAVLACSQWAAADPGQWSRVGRAGDWKQTICATSDGSVMYSVESSGRLYLTNLRTGEWAPIGGADFAKTRFMLPGGNSLYTIESDGTLYRVDAGSGQWRALGQQGAWKKTTAATIIDQRWIYNTELDGYLYRTDARDGTFVRIGDRDFGSVERMHASGGLLYMLESNGSLYEASPDSGVRTRIGQQGEWKNTIASTIHNGLLYTVESSGRLYVTDLSSGRWQPIGRADFVNTTFLLSGRSSLFSIEKDGSLYRIETE